jgi:hypothetical protein
VKRWIERGISLTLTPEECLVLAKGQALTAPDILPGFSLPLVDLFRE